MHLIVDGDMWSAWADIEEPYRNLSWGTLSQNGPEGGSYHGDPLNEQTEVSAPREAA